MAVKKAVKKSAAKNSKNKTKSSKKAAAKGPRLFPTKAELEALKAAKSAPKKKDDDKKKSGPRLFPTKAELEARRLAALGKSAPAAPVKTGKASKAIVDGEEVELEEVELEDLETLVEEATEIAESEKEVPGVWQVPQLIWSLPLNLFS